MKNLWTEKFRPKTLDEYVFQDGNQEKLIRSWIQEGITPHLLFHGPAGTGKTTLAKIIINELQIDEFDVLEANGSKEGRKIEWLTNELEVFCSTMPFGEYKIVFIDEADGLNPVSVQPALRNLMETYAGTCRFILTCNEPHRIIPYIKDRCQEFKIEKHDINEFTARVAQVLLAEDVMFELDLLDTYVKATYPSLRKALNVVQQKTIDKVLIEDTTSVETSVDVLIKAVDLIKNNKLRDARIIVSENIRQDELTKTIRWMYDNLGLWASNDDQEDEAIVIIKEAMITSVGTPDHEIHISGTLVELIGIQK